MRVPALQGTERAQHRDVDQPGVCSRPNRAQATARVGARVYVTVTAGCAPRRLLPEPTNGWAPAPRSAVCVASGPTNPPVAAGRSRRQILYPRPLGFCGSWYLADALVTAAPTHSANTCLVAPAFGASCEVACSKGGVALPRDSHL